ncbi:hypothetical protein [Amycolatopsis cihanbeyliensis]|uniref:hypothetical protein n=1 Tax=Amycolatopsis cihanbeyliensis TaxID=1128664 RepID=UPI0011547892|nr:hypothetical protein [Amycolatopsis cihanbeyliensis]
MTATTGRAAIGDYGRPTPGRSNRGQPGDSRSGPSVDHSGPADTGYSLVVPLLVLLPQFLKVLRGRMSPIERLDPPGPRRRWRCRPDGLAPRERPTG